LREEHPEFFTSLPHHAPNGIPYYHDSGEQWGMIGFLNNDDLTDAAVITGMTSIDHEIVVDDVTHQWTGWTGNDQTIASDSFSWLIPWVYQLEADFDDTDILDSLAPADELIEIVEQQFT